MKRSIYLIITLIVFLLGTAPDRLCDYHPRKAELMDLFTRRMQESYMLSDPARFTAPFIESALDIGETAVDPIDPPAALLPTTD